MSQYYDLDKGKNVSIYMNDCSSTSGYSSTNSPSPVSMTMTLSPAHSPETMALQTDFDNLTLPAANVNSPLHAMQNTPYQQSQQNQLLPNAAGISIDGNNLLNGGGSTLNINIANMYMDHHNYTYGTTATTAGAPAAGAFGASAATSLHATDAAPAREFSAWLHIAEQPVEKFRFRYKSEMHGTHGSLNGANSKRTPKTFPEVELRNYKGPAVIRCSLFQTNLDSPHSHQLVVRKEDRDVCDPHDLRVSADQGYVAQFMNMGIIHTAKKYIFDELLKKKQDRLVFQLGRRELSTKQIQELHQETEREAKDMNLNQVRLCFEAFKVESPTTWTPIAKPVFSNAINNRKSAQTGELRIVRLSKPTGSVSGNDELILLVEKVSKKNIKVRFFEENDDGETVWEAFAKFRESDVHHQYAIVCQTPAYKDKDVDREVPVSIELIRPSDDERSYPPLPFRYKPREAIISRKRRRTASMATTSSSSSSSGSAANSFELPKPVQQLQPRQNALQDIQTISQEFGRDEHLNDLLSLNIAPDNFQALMEQDSADLEKICLQDIYIPDLPQEELQADGHSRCVTQMNARVSNNRNTSSSYLNAIFKIFEESRRLTPGDVGFESARKKVEELFTTHALKNYNNDTLLHEVISQKKDNLKLAIKTFQVMNFFGLHDVANTLNADGNSGLHFACQQDRAHYVRPLLTMGCLPNTQNHSGNTALHIAVKEERLNCIDSFLNGPTITLNLTIKNDDGLTPLHMAIRQNKFDVAKKLIKHDGKSVNVVNTKDGNNALHMAVLEQNFELLVVILDSQDLSDVLLARNAAGYTPLELARRRANKECVRVLEQVQPDLTMTWIPCSVKAEADSSSAEDDDESSETAMENKMDDIEIKPEDIKEELPDEFEDEQQKLQADPAHSLMHLLKDEAKQRNLSKLLNEKWERDDKKFKWQQLAESLKMSHMVFLWTDADELLKYIERSNNIDYNSFANALRTIDPKALDALNKKLISNMAQIIDGKVISKQIRCELSKEVQDLISAGYRAPHLTAVIVGEDPASQTYVRNKILACEEIGISSDTKVLPKSTTQEELLKIIEEVNKDPKVDGLLVQLPVPEHIDERTVCNAVTADKDVDGFNEVNIGRLALDMEGIIPATPLGIKELLKRSNIETFGRNAVVVGRSKNVSLPMAILLHSDGKNATKALDATVTVCHRYTPPKELAKYCRMADIVVVAVGKPGLITKDMIKPGACVIDVGINRIKDEKTGKTKLVGDVDYDEVREVAGHITPVPGGVGPMTVAMLMHNTLQAAKKNLCKADQ
ncbi:nuclear factor NF-kappa-B p110 subunit [Scaptodrosophila lebanonensis]|uniref:methenyltetrahydrofolate cyclohydrolase n=1 Tax=Drosophila lebanonensis TaxID=7225 RepID=A0A6J2TMB9_DROLE|nr:nuclear factor NF-kappa-B p110 subunit [Scaptodrosophila lebanonensis]